MDPHRLYFWPDGKEIVVKESTSILEAATLAGVQINNLCKSASKIEIIGDARQVQDLFTATQAGYQLALSY